MFWKRFYELCSAKGTKPTPFGKEIGISSGIISKWKNEKTLPNGETLIKIADHLNCSIDYLLGREDKTTNADTALKLNRAEQRLVYDFRQLNQQGQEYILQTMDMAKDKYKKVDNFSDMENSVGM